MLKVKKRTGKAMLISAPLLLLVDIWGSSWLWHALGTDHRSWWAFPLFMSSILIGAMSVAVGAIGGYTMECGND